MSKKAKKAIEETDMMNARKPVRERGLALLDRIYAEGGLYLTKDEGEEIVQNGDAVAIAGEVDDFGAALVQLTERGAAKVTGETVEKDDKKMNAFEIDDYAPDVTAIVRHRGGGRRGSKYPFDALEVGQSFHVPPTDKIPDAVKALQSSVTKANALYTENVTDDAGNEVLEEKTIKTYRRGEDGKLLREDGHFIVETAEVRRVPVTRQMRKFVVVPAAADDPKGPGARVVRTM